MYLLHNFKIIPEEKFSLTYTNRAFQYNDGLFDTLIMENGQIRFLADHLERTHKALQVLQIQVPSELQDLDQLEAIIQELAEHNQVRHQRARMKMHIWRMPGGLFTPEQNTAESLITLQPQSSFKPIIAHADFAATVRNAYSPLSFFKGPFAVNYVLASLEKEQKQLDELILLTDQGFVSEALIANVFWVKESVLYTPSLQTGCIAGIVRKNIIRLATTENLKIKEGFFTESELLNAEVIFTTNVTGLRPIQVIKSKEFLSDHPVLNQLHQLLFSGN